MNNRVEVRDFLTSRRARIKPEQVGLPSGKNRRVAGLRRSEVATLANLSVEYYSRLERGGISGATPEVLDALARALRLSDDERAHLFDLAHAAHPVARPPKNRGANTWKAHPTLQWTLDSITRGPALVRNGRMDVLAYNLLGRAFYKDAFDMPGATPNFAKFIFLDQRGKDFHKDWERAADTAVQILRAEGARNSHDEEHHKLVGELSTRSEEFRRRWADHDVWRPGAGLKYFRHPIVGDVTVAFEGLEMASEPGLTLTIYTPEPGSASEDAMQLLASWAASEYGESDEVICDKTRAADL
ncbi:MAG: helix-turn-helix transcriptional regulator [Ancrocorticia sp.]